jgi:thioredoxin 1
VKVKKRGLVIALVLIGVAVAAIFVLKDGGDPVLPADAAETDLPKIVDYGSKMCIPCQEMAVTLDEVKREYKDRVIVEIVDVYENYDLAEAAGVTTIPTQIFYDAAGKEVYRHVGVMTKEEIVAQLELMGID